MILTNSIKLKWETSIECWMLTCDSKHNLQIEVFKTCGRTMSPRANTILKIKIIMNDLETSLTASDPAAGWGGGQETLNLCGSLWAPSFLWLISTGLGGGAMAPSAPPRIRYWLTLKLFGVMHCRAQAVSVYTGSTHGLVQHWMD